MPFPFLGIVLLVGAALFAGFQVIQAFSIKGQPPLINVPQNVPDNNNFDVFDWLFKIPLDALYDLIFSGVPEFVKWLATGLSGILQTILNIVISFLNERMRLNVPSISIPVEFTAVLIITLLALFILNQIRGLLDRAYTGYILVLSLLLTAISVILILIIFTSFFMH